MGSHHHLHHHPTAASYCYCYSPYSQCHHHPPPPPSPPDCQPLFHPPPQPHLYSSQTYLPNLRQDHPHLQERYLREERETQHTISSLLRRIAALESTLRSRSTSSSPNSLRSAAARTIQTHFRAFLLRRSRTLRQLKDLASIKSTLSSLKSSVSEQTYFDYDLVYHHARELVIKLDTIQGDDPMIRDGKSSVRRELNKFFDFIDGFYSRLNMRSDMTNQKIRVPNVQRKMGNVKNGGLRSVTMNKLRGLVERVDKLTEELAEDGECEVNERSMVSDDKNKNRGLTRQLCGARVRPKVKKSVSFADNGKVYRVLDENDDDDDDSVDIADLVSKDFEDDLCREIEVASMEADDDNEDDEVEAQSENGSDDKKYSRSCLRNGGNFERRIYNQGEVDNIAFSAPTPLKMETRADLIDKRKKLADDS